MDYLLINTNTVFAEVDTRMINIIIALIIPSLYKSENLYLIKGWKKVQTKVILVTSYAEQENTEYRHHE